MSRLLVFVVALALAGLSPAVAADQAEVEAGAQIYGDKCSECHGPRLRNPGTSFDLKRLTAEERPRFEKSVMEGKGQMPPWRGILNDEQISQLWAYIREYAYQ